MRFNFETTQGMDAEDALAAQKVLNTYELRKPILADLGIKDLARARRINKVWKAHIDRALALRKILHLEPAEATEWLRWVKPADSDEYSPELAYDGESKGRPIVKLHPILHAVTNSMATWAKTSTEFSLDTLRLLETPRGQWEQMMITQSPVKTLRIVCRVKGGVRGCLKYSVEGTSGSGITLGTLLRAMWHFIRRGDIGQVSFIDNGSNGLVLPDSHCLAKMWVDLKVDAFVCEAASCLPDASPFVLEARAKAEERQTHG